MSDYQRIEVDHYPILSFFDEIPGESLIVFISQVLMASFDNDHFYVVFGTGIGAP